MVISHSFVEMQLLFETQRQFGWFVSELKNMQNYASTWFTSEFLLENAAYQPFKCLKFVITKGARPSAGIVITTKVHDLVHWLSKIFYMSLSAKNMDDRISRNLTALWV